MPVTMKLATALSFLAFVGLCVVFASADPSSPPSSAPPRLFNNDVLKTCPDPTGLVVGNTGGCKITVGNADNTQSDDIFIGTKGGNTQVTIGKATSDISVTGDVVNVKGTTLKLGSNSDILITATGTTLSLGKDGSTTTASTIDIFSDDEININGDGQVEIYSSGNVVVFADATTYIGQNVDGTESSNYVRIAPANTRIVSDTVEISGSTSVTISGSIFAAESTATNLNSPTTNIAGTTLSVTSGTTNLNSPTTNIAGTTLSVTSGTTNLNSPTTNIAGTTLSVTSGSINLGTSTTTDILIGSSTTTSLSLTVEPANYIVLDGSAATTSPAIGALSDAGVCDITVALASGAGSTNNAGSISFTSGSPNDTCVVTVSFTGISGANPFVVISPMNSATSDAQPYVSAVSGTGFSVGFASAPAGAIQFSYIVLFGASP